eukprot:Polyplicarium_translucidae@DN2912_c0_g2_i2.p1
MDRIATRYDILQLAVCLKLSLTNMHQLVEGAPFLVSKVVGFPVTESRGPPDHAGTDDALESFDVNVLNSVTSATTRNPMAEARGPSHTAEGQPIAPLMQWQTRHNFLWAPPPAVTQGPWSDSRTSSSR